MEDKIKIFIPENIYNVLIEDASSFGFLKNNGEVNRNDFFNTLIVNYHDTYLEENKDTFEELKRIVNKYDIKLKDNEMSDISTELLAYVLAKNNNDDEDKKYKTFSLKPTKASIDTITFIENFALKNSSLSAYIRNLLISYCNKPKNKREQIIFVDNYKKLQKAIGTKTAVYGYSKKNKEVQKVYPYAIACGKEELFNYLVCTYNDAVKTLRISNIKSITNTNEPVNFSDEQIKSLEATIKYGPQFSINEVSESCVKLTDYGQVMFKKFYVHRPTPTRIEGDLYYFESAKDQLFTYFSRFGKNAYVVYPEKLRSELHIFFIMANKHYKKENSTNLYINKD